MKRSSHDAPTAGHTGKPGRRLGFDPRTRFRSTCGEALAMAHRSRPAAPVVAHRPRPSPGLRRTARSAGEPETGDVVSVDPPHELVHRWGDDLVRSRPSPTETGCRLTLEQTMRERDHAAMNAA